MNHERLVSVVIPCFNARETVGAAIRSALEQTWPEREVVVVDDGSTDDTLDVVRSFGKHVRWETGPNRGATWARNRGVSIARGAWIQFLDADDVLFPEKIERQADLAFANPGTLVFCDAETVGVDGTVRRGSYLPPFAGGDPLIFMLRHQVQTSAPLHNKRRLEAVGGFDEKLPCAQEYDLNLRLACAGASLHHMRECLYRLQQRAGSVSSNYLRVLSEQRRILLRVASTLKNSSGWNEQRARAVAAELARVARQALRNGDPRLAEECFLAARAMHASGGLEAFGTAYRLAHRLIGASAAEWLARAGRGVRL